MDRRQILAGLLAGAALPSALWADGSIRPPRRPEGLGQPEAKGDTARLITAAKLGDQAQVGFVVMDATTGQVLEAHQPDTQLPPASVAKAVTAGFALARLGAGYRFATRVLATGPVQGGRVQGDLILAGGGDPTLQTDQLGAMALRLAQGGIKGVTGRFLYWDGALPEIYEIAKDQPDYLGYNAAVAGLNLNFNRVHFEWKRDGAGGWSLAMDARGERFVPEVRLARAEVVDRDAPLFTFASSAGREDWTVASSALGKGGSRWLPTRQPALYTAEVFRTLCAAQGIKLPDPMQSASAPTGTEVARMESEPLPELLRAMLRHSTNITAEAVGLTASGKPDLVTSAADMAAWAKGAFGADLLHLDHSGLGGESRVTPTQMARYLLSERKQGTALRDILRDVGMRDEAGKTIKGHATKVMAKSGTLNFASGLGGHIIPPQGRELIFAIFMADLPRRAGLAESQKESPEGGEAWTKRARTLQGQLIARWAGAFT